MQSDPPSPVEVIRHGPIITPEMLPGRDGANINGPSLIKVPAWVGRPLGNYYLYFAHHRGNYIRLAYADEITGPWRIHEGGVLGLDECPFVTGHIASPEALVEERDRLIVMYFHGPSAVAGSQMTFAAVSDDGLRFAAMPEIVGPSYARVFEHDGWRYALLGADGQRVYRSTKGLREFEPGPMVLPGDNGIDPFSRHVALQKMGDILGVYYTRKRDAPERIVFGTIDLRRDWKNWIVVDTVELMRPETNYEGADEPVVPSKPGPAKRRENALRDPAVYEEGGRTWLLYAVAGERGIALAELRFEAGK